MRRGERVLREVDVGERERDVGERDKTEKVVCAPDHWHQVYLCV